MKILLKYLSITIFSCSFWTVIYASMLKGYRFISTTECVICLLAGVLGFVVSSVALCKIEAKEGK